MHAEGLWERMKDHRDKEFPITHDGKYIYTKSQHLLIIYKSSISSVFVVSIDYDEENTDSPTGVEVMTFHMHTSWML